MTEFCTITIKNIATETRDAFNQCCEFHGLTRQEFLTLLVNGAKEFQSFSDDAKEALGWAYTDAKEEQNGS